MKTVIRNIGNSKGVVVPVYLLNAMKLVSGDQIDIRQKDGNIILTPASKTTYSLDVLLAQCDPSAPLPSELVEWDNADSVKNEF